MDFMLLQCAEQPVDTGMRNLARDTKQLEGHARASIQIAKVVGVNRCTRQRWEGR